MFSVINISISQFFNRLIKEFAKFTNMFQTGLLYIPFPTQVGTGKHTQLFGHLFWFQTLIFTSLAKRKIVCVRFPSLCHKANSPLHARWTHKKRLISFSESKERCKGRALKIFSDTYTMWLIVVINFDV